MLSVIEKTNRNNGDKTRLAQTLDKEDMRYRF